jgi:preprotein translocase subunit SecY
MQDLLIQIFTMQTEISPEIQQELVHESLSNYVLILAFFSVLLIVAGVVFASAKARKLKRQINAARSAHSLIASDLHEEESITNNQTATESEA